MSSWKNPRRNLYWYTRRKCFALFDTPFHKDFLKEWQKKLFEELLIKTQSLTLKIFQEDFLRKFQKELLKKFQEELLRESERELLKEFQKGLSCKALNESLLELQKKSRQTLREEFSKVDVPEKKVPKGSATLS